VCPSNASALIGWSQSTTAGMMKWYFRFDTQWWLQPEIAVQIMHLFRPLLSWHLQN